VAARDAGSSRRLPSKPRRRAIDVGDVINARALTAAGLMK